MHVSIIAHKGHRGQPISWQAVSRSYEKSYVNAGNIAILSYLYEKFSQLI